MQKTKQKLNISMFSGGRGTTSLTKALLDHPQINLTLLVNAYDDGLSTGALRDFIPGLLGISDVRKNITQMMDESDPSKSALKTILEFRFPESVKDEQALKTLNGLSQQADIPFEELKKSKSKLTLIQHQFLSKWVDCFLTYLYAQVRAGKTFNFADCSLGNLIIAGCYLDSDKNFNKAITQATSLCEIRGNVFNVTDGQNLVLTALKENGTFMPTEASIVSSQDDAPIEKLYLLPSYLEKEEWGSKTKVELKKSLELKSISPLLNPDAEKSLREADIIIYGPGTQHSSLFPSYLTQKMGEVIAKNKEAEKIFIGNIIKDHEIVSETATSLVKKLIFYLNEKSNKKREWSEYITLFLFQNSQKLSDGPNYVPLEPEKLPYPKRNVIIADWETGKGKHSGPRVADEIIGIVNAKLQKKINLLRRTVSIVVPGLNEEKTVERVLRDLVRLNIEPLGLGKEILFIDGGSTDKTFELAQSVYGVKTHQLRNEKGRGAALRMGIDAATGDIIVFFPSDNEYEVKDLVPVINGITQNDFEVVFGSRAIKCMNLSGRIRKIYNNNFLMYFVSKYGGILASTIGLLLYNRFVSDVFTGIKAFKADTLKSLKLNATGFEIETEIVSKLGKKRAFILEIPVSFSPRTRKQGKKSTFFDGLRALFRLFTELFRR